MSFLQVINPFGLLFAVLLLLPHILFRGLRTVTKENVPNLGMYWLDRLGRFGSLFLTAVLVLVYWLLWILFSKRNNQAAAYGIVAASAAAVMLSGILQVNTLLLTAGVVYLIGELYIVRHRDREASP